MSRIMQQSINHTTPHKSTQFGNKTFYTDIDGIKWLRIENASQSSVEYWPGAFIDDEKKYWRYIGNGSYNVVYQCENTVYKIQRPCTSHVRPDLPERSVRVWNEINNPDNDLALQAAMYDEGWTAPFISGSSPTAWEIAIALIDIYQRTRRIVADAYSDFINAAGKKIFANFIKTEEKKIICIDIGAAVRFEEKLERSQTSYNIWEKLGQQYNGIYIELEEFSSNDRLAIIIKALLYIELFDLELADINLLKTKPFLAEKLAIAYETSNPNASIAPLYLLTREIILQRSRENNVNDPNRFCFKQKKYYRLARLFELGIEEERARIMARDPEFTHDQFYELEKRIESKLPIKDQLNAIIKLDNDELLYGMIRESWKETKGCNFLCFCTTDPDAEEAYRKIQRLYRDNPSSKQRSGIGVISFLWEFSRKERNQSNPFAKALKNKFNFESITLADIEHAFAVRSAETVNLLSGAQAAPHFSC